MTYPLTRGRCGLIPFVNCCNATPRLSHFEKRGAGRERYKLRVVLGHPIGDLSLDRLTAAEIARYRDDQIAVVKGDTVRRELAIVQHCLELARKEWGIALLQNPTRFVRSSYLPSDVQATVGQPLSKSRSSLRHVATLGAGGYPL